MPEFSRSYVRELIERDVPDLAHYAYAEWIWSLVNVAYQKGIERVMADKITQGDLTKEEWREYSFNGRPESYRIDAPKTLFMREGGTTHRVLDAAGVVHCVPASGNQGCVLRWKPKDSADPVQF